MNTRHDMAWEKTSKLRARSYRCGYCGNIVATEDGYCTKHVSVGLGGRVRGTYSEDIYICSFCNRPSYFYASGNRQVPGPIFGYHVDHLPADVNSLYDEARRCMSVDAYTAAALICRKLLMNTAVNLGAQAGQRFAHYVSHLVDEHHVPPSSRKWVDAIRDKGNEAAHEIINTSETDANNLIGFVEMLLKLVYEYPSKVT